MRDGHNGYAPSVGIPPAREAVADECARRGMPVSADRVVHHVGHVGGHRAGADGAGRGRATKCSCRSRPIRSTPRCSPRSARGRSSTGPIPRNGWLPDLDHIRSLITPATRALVVDRSEQPDRRHLSDAVRRALVDIADEHNIPLLADEVYADLAFDGPVPPIAAAQPRRAGHLVLVAVEGLPRARLARRLDGGRPHRSAGRRAGGGEEAGGRPAVRDRADGVRDHRGAQRRPHAPGARSATALRERAELTIARLNAIDGITCVAPTAAFYAMPQVALPPGVTDEDYVLGAAARDRRALRLRLRLRHQARGRLLPRSSSSRRRRSSRRSTTTSPLHRATSSPAGDAAARRADGLVDVRAEVAATSGRSG